MLITTSCELLFFDNNSLSRVALQISANATQIPYLTRQQIDYNLLLLTPDGHWRTGLHSGQSW